MWITMGKRINVNRILAIQSWIYIIYATILPFYDYFRLKLKKCLSKKKKERRGRKRKEKNTVASFTEKFSVSYALLELTLFLSPLNIGTRCGPHPPHPPSYATGTERWILSIKLLLKLNTCSFKIKYSFAELENLVCTRHLNLFCLS